MAKKYKYSAQVIRVIDGDTLELRIDLGFGVFHQGTFRLVGIDCPEPRGGTRKAGKLATQETVLWVEANANWIVCVSYVNHRGKRHRGKYGRWIVDLETTRRCDLFPDSLVDHLVRSGHATRTFTRD